MVEHYYLNKHFCDKCSFFACSYPCAYDEDAVTPWITLKMNTRCPQQSLSLYANNRLYLIRLSLMSSFRFFKNHWYWLFVSWDCDSLREMACALQWPLWAMPAGVSSYFYTANVECHDVSGNFQIAFCLRVNSQNSQEKLNISVFPRSMHYHLL